MREHCRRISAKKNESHAIGTFTFSSSTFTVLGTVFRGSLRATDTCQPPALLLVCKIVKAFMSSTEI